MNASSDKWMAVSKAREFILDRIEPVSGSEALPIADALGRISANDILSPILVPGHDNSAMDGFAVRFEDLTPEKPSTLKIIGESFAGHPCSATVSAGTCVKIMTGAPIPDGADTIIPHEETSGDGDTVEIKPKSRKRGQSLRRAGEDLSPDDTAVPAGKLLGAAEIGLLASLGVAEVQVKPKLSVALFSTGDELRPVGSQLEFGQIYDSNRYTLGAMIRSMGFHPVDLGVAEDTPEAIDQSLMKAAESAHAVVTSGGVSVGEADFVKQVLESRGEVLFWKIAMKPGRPLAYGKVASADFFGLPGNPVSVMVTFLQFVRPALWRRAGRSDYTEPLTLRAVCISPLRKVAGRTEFQRGILKRGDDGWTVDTTGDQGSGILSSMSQANCLIVLDDDQGNVDAGAEVTVEPFGEPL